MGDAALSIKLQSGIKVSPGGSSALNIHKTSELLTSLLFTLSVALSLLVSRDSPEQNSSQLEDVESLIDASPASEH